MPQHDSNSQGILYLAKGEQFIDEATISARRTKSVMADCPITIVTNQEVTADCFDTVLFDERPFMKRDKPRAMQQTPYDRTIYLDTDIFLEDAVHELFDILDQFDIAARINRDLSHIPKDGDSPVDGVSPGVPEYNTGVIPYRNTSCVMDLLSDWEKRCYPEHKWDQRSFRPAIYHSDARICPLETRYNCMYRYNNTVDGKVKVFHGPLVNRPIFRTPPE